MDAALVHRKLFDKACQIASRAVMQDTSLAGKHFAVNVDTDEWLTGSNPYEAYRMSCKFPESAQVFLVGAETAQHYQKHSTTLAGYQSAPEFAWMFGRLRYDVTASFFEELVEEFRRQAGADRARGRTNLAQCLDGVAESLQGVQRRMAHVWSICEPHMKDIT